MAAGQCIPLCNLDMKTLSSPDCKRVRAEVQQFSLLRQHSLWECLIIYQASVHQGREWDNKGGIVCVVSSCRRNSRKSDGDSSARLRGIGLDQSLNEEPLLEAHRMVNRGDRQSLAKCLTEKGGIRVSMIKLIEGSRIAIFDCIESWYNHQRRDSLLNYLTSARYAPRFRALA